MGWLNGPKSGNDIWPSRLHTNCARNETRRTTRRVRASERSAYDRHRHYCVHRVCYASGGVWSSIAWRVVITRAQSSTSISHRARTTTFSTTPSRTARLRGYGLLYRILRPWSKASVVVFFLFLLTVGARRLVVPDGVARTAACGRTGNVASKRSSPPWFRSSQLSYWSGAVWQWTDDPATSGPYSTDYYNYTIVCVAVTTTVVVIVVVVMVVMAE